eukprot:scaffold173588_cov18-Tisochrysis_lutea.AAC.1
MPKQEQRPGKPQPNAAETSRGTLHQQHCVDHAIVLWVVGHLRPDTGAESVGGYKLGLGKHTVGAAPKEGGMKAEARL